MLAKEAGVALRMGLLGTGTWASGVHAPGLAVHPDVTLVGVWGRSHERARQVAAQAGTVAYASLDRLLDDVDAVAIAVPPDVQAALATEAVRRGRHLVLEKPIATSAQEATALRDAVEARGLASVVFFTRRFIPAFADWLDGAAAREWDHGRVELLSAALGTDTAYSRSAWRQQRGALWDLGPHALSVLRPVLGPVVAVSGVAGTRDLVQLTLEHTSGAISTVTSSLTVQPHTARTVHAFFGGSGSTLAPPDDTAGPDPYPEAYQAALDALLVQVRSGDPGHPCDIRLGFATVQVLVAAENALSTGQRRVLVQNVP